MSIPETPTRPVYRVAAAAVVVAAIRLTGAAVGFGAAIATGAEPPPAGLAFAFGVGASVVALVSNQRWAFYHPPDIEDASPGSLHTDALARAVQNALLPSTAGVGALLAVSLLFEPLLSAALAGILGGMCLVGLASLVDVALWERRERRSLFADLSRPPRRYSVPR